MVESHTGMFLFFILISIVSFACFLFCPVYLVHPPLPPCFPSDLVVWDLYLNLTRCKSPGARHSCFVGVSLSPACRTLWGMSNCRLRPAPLAFWYHLSRTNEDHRVVYSCSVQSLLWPCIAAPRSTSYLFRNKGVGSWNFVNFRALVHVGSKFADSFLFPHPFFFSLMPDLLQSCLWSGT